MRNLKKMSQQSCTIVILPERICITDGAEKASETQQEESTPSAGHMRHMSLTDFHRTKIYI